MHMQFSQDLRRSRLSTTKLQEPVSKGRNNLVLLEISSFKAGENELQPLKISFGLSFPATNSSVLSRNLMANLAGWKFVEC